MPETAPPPAKPSSDGAPFGSTPATSATPNKGFEAAALQQVGVVVNQLVKIMAGVGANTEVGKAIMKILPTLSKLVPAGAVTPAGERQQLQKQMMEALQRNQGMQAYKAQQAKSMMGGGQGGPPGGQPGQMPQQQQAAA